jgi:hypothetical protein
VKSETTNAGTVIITPNVWVAPYNPGGWRKCPDKNKENQYGKISIVNGVGRKY